MAGKSYTFRGSGDFSDFNSKAKEAASTMGDSFKKAYEEMLKNADKYSSSSKKQLDYLSSAFQKFKESSSSDIDSTLDSLFEEMRKEEKSSLSNLDNWKKSKLEKNTVENAYRESIGLKPVEPTKPKEVEVNQDYLDYKATNPSEEHLENFRKRRGLDEEGRSIRKKKENEEEASRTSTTDFDPLSQRFRDFKKQYESQINNEYRERSSKISERTENSSSELDQLRVLLDETLGSMNPKEYFQKIKDLAKEQIIEAKKQNKNIADVISQLESSGRIEDKLLASQLREESVSESRLVRRDEKESEREEKTRKDDSGQSILKDLSNFDYLGKITNMGQGLAKSKNGSELFGELVDGVAAAGGGLSQLLMTGIGAGIGGPIGAALGGAASVIFGKTIEGGVKIVGEAVKRTMDERESLSSSMNNYRSLTGSKETFRDLSYQGVDYKAFVEEQSSLAKSQGKRVDNDTVETSLSLQKGYEIDKGTISSLLEIQRGTNKELSSTIGRILTHGERDVFRGGDRTFLPEFLQKFITLQKDFLKNQGQVKDSTVLDVFSMFDKIGGQFSTKDYRSTGNIETINNSLANPQNDALKALSYKLVSDRNPNSDFFDIQMEIQKGLSSPEYFKDRLRFIKDNYKDDPSLVKSEISQQFGLTDNLEAAKSIYDNMDKILSSNISKEELSSKYGLGTYKGEAEKSTTMMERQQAQITNEFVKSAVDGMKMAAEALVNTVQQAFAGATFTVKNGEVNFSRTTIKSNEVKSPSNPNKKYLGMSGLTYGTSDSSLGGDWIPLNGK